MQTGAVLLWKFNLNVVLCDQPCGKKKLKVEDPQHQHPLAETSRKEKRKGENERQAFNITPSTFAAASQLLRLKYVYFAHYS